MSKKKQDIYRGHKTKGLWFLDEFEHIYTCWANHRNNWSKAFEKHYAKRRMRQNQKDEIQQELEDMDNDD